MKKPYKGAERTQTIITESGIELIINHSRKDKCSKCKEEIIWGLVPLELVGLAKWDIHKCKEKNLENETQTQMAIC